MQYIKFEVGLTALTFQLFQLVEVGIQSELSVAILPLPHSLPLLLNNQYIQQ